MKLKKPWRNTGNHGAEEAQLTNAPGDETMTHRWRREEEIVREKWKQS